MLYFVVRELQNSQFSMANLCFFCLKVLEAFSYVLDEVVMLWGYILADREVGFGMPIFSVVHYMAQNLPLGV